MHASFLSEVAQAMPLWMASTQGWQSLLYVHPGSAHNAACRIAQASDPGMSVIQSGGTPRAMAMMTSRSGASTTTDQPFLAHSSVGPSRRDPSVYTLPLKVPPGGRMIQWKVAAAEALGMVTQLLGTRPRVNSAEFDNRPRAALVLGPGGASLRRSGSSDGQTQMRCLSVPLGTSV